MATKIVIPTVYIEKDGVAISELVDLEFEVVNENEDAKAEIDYQANGGNPILKVRRLRI